MMYLLKYLGTNKHSLNITTCNYLDNNINNNITYRNNLNIK